MIDFPLSLFFYFQREGANARACHLKMKGDWKIDLDTQGAYTIDSDYDIIDYDRGT